MANQQPYSYRPVMNRNVTRKWAEARQVNYGGDDWGDDGYGPSPDEEPIHNPLSHGQRSFTNPVVDTRQRMSFDREPENRNFSAGAGPAPGLPFGSASAQPAPFTAAAGPRYYGQPQQPVYEQPQYPQTRVLEPQGRTSVDSFRRDAPRPESRESAAASMHPPRKSSLGQNDFKDYSQPDTLQTATAPAENLNAKPLPFIRPADIWKKHEEAEKERRSQESSTRPSLDSVRKDSEEKVSPPPVELEQNRRRQPALDTVAERKSEYFDNLVDPPVQSEARGLNAAQTTPMRNPASQAPTLPSTAPRQVDQPKPIPTTTNVFAAPASNIAQTAPINNLTSRAPTLPLSSSRQTDQSKPTPTTTSAFTAQATPLHNPLSQVPNLPLNSSRQTDQPTISTTTNTFDTPTPNIAQTRSQNAPVTRAPTLPVSSQLTDQSKPIPTTTNVFASPPSNIAQTKSADAPVPQAPTLPSSSSRQPDQSKSIPAAVNTATPVSTSTENRSATTGRPALPQISRTSTFGPDFLYTAIPTNQPLTHDTAQLPGTKLPSTTAQPELQQTPAQPYRSMVQNAFESENRRRDDSPTTESLLRTNTTSTSDISPIVSSPMNEPFGHSRRDNAAYVRDTPRSPINHSSHEEEIFPPPRRVNTDRRESPSPARRPQSLVAPDMPEPLSAVTSPDGHTPAPDTARAAQVVRPGLANLVHQRGPSREHIHSDPTREIKPKTQGSMDSDTSDLSNQRTTSEEWASWNAARSEAHARHGIQDSKPPTPGVSSSVTSTPVPFESLDRNVHMPSNAGNVSASSAALPTLPSQRPQVTRDESFRPSLPGGWTSSSSIQKAETQQPLASQIRPPLADSLASTESIPTATAPRDADWRSQYRSSSQGGALAAASAAGAAMAGIFNGPSLTLSGRRPESEVSSIDEADEGPTGLHRDVSMKSRDFATSSEPPQMSKQSAARDFAATSPPASDVPPKAKQLPLNKTTELEKPILALPGQAAYSLPPQRSAAHDSPTKESERWWSSSEDEAESAPAPAPLRTNRLSTIEPSHTSISPVSRLTDTDNERLESDIVNRLTPKSSNINTTSSQTGRVSPVRERNNEKSVSPPFAAAALAVSPGRDYKALEEQNAFQPLTAPSSKTISPISQKTNQSATGMPPIPTTMTEQNSSSLHSKSSVPLPAVTLPISPSRDRASEAPSLPAFDAAKAGPAVLHGSRSEPKTVSNDSIREDHPPALNQGVDRSITNQPLSSTSVAPPKTTNLGTSPAAAQIHGASTANQAVTMPTAKAPATNDLTRDQSLTPAKDLSKPVHTTTQPIVRQPSLARSEVSAMSAPTTPVVSKAAVSTRAYDPSRAFPSDKFSSEQISNMQSPAQRINAYNENRTAYAESVGHLENWLSHMNTPENAGHFATRPIDTPSYASSERFDKRDSSASPGATKIQADGKKMLASASKMGQKASVLGKGLFSKGKEKLRTASASQKVAR